jgi:hypothetical protein
MVEVKRLRGGLDDTALLPRLVPRSHELALAAFLG